MQSTGDCARVGTKRARVRTTSTVNSSTNPSSFRVYRVAGASYGCRGTLVPGLSRNGGNLRLIFAYTVFMFHGPTSGIHPFVISCKGCQQNIPAPVQTLPDSWIVAECPLCGEKRRYLPADIFRGRLSHDLLMKPPRISDRR